MTSSIVVCVQIFDLQKKTSMFLKLAVMGIGEVC